MEPGVELELGVELGLVLEFELGGEAGFFSEIAAALVCLWMFIRTCKNDEVFIKNND